MLDCLPLQQTETIVAGGPIGVYKLAHPEWGSELQELQPEDPAGAHTEPKDLL